jgi:hypothetical protein
MSRKYCELSGRSPRARNRASGALQTQPRSCLTARERVHRNAFDMEGNEKKKKQNKVKKPCAACKKLKKFCPHNLYVYIDSQERACTLCRGKHDKCTHEPGAGAGAIVASVAAAVTAPAAAPARLSYAAVARAAPSARGLTGPELEAAAAFAAPGLREYEVIYFDEKRVRVPWNRALR